MDASHNDPVTAARDLEASRRNSPEVAPLEAAVYALLLSRSRRILRRLQALDSQTPPKPATK